MVDFGEKGKGCSHEGWLKAINCKRRLRERLKFKGCKHC